MAACVGVALIVPTLAIAASEWAGALAAAAVILAGGVALVLLASLALRQREAALQAQARRDRLEAARRAAMGVAGATLSASDGDTAEHSDEVAQLCEVLCEEFEITGDERERVLMAAHLHDIGKVAVSSEILNKPGPLDEAEWAVIKEHTLVGERILRAVPELDQAAALVRHSHEHFDGSGYPDGLAGDQIPLGSRVVLTADAFHAIRSDRPYRKGRPPSQALAELKAHAGTQFDPKIVEALERNAARLRRGVGARIPLSRRTVALLVGGILALVGSALATGILPISKPGADQPPASLPDDGNAPPSEGQVAPAPQQPNPAATRHKRSTRKSSRGHNRASQKRAKSSSRGGRTNTPTPANSPSTGNGPDHPTPVRAHGSPDHANGVARGRPPTVTPRGRGK